MAASSRRIVINTMSGIAARLVSVAIIFVTTPLLVHRLGDDGFGLLAVMGALAAYAGLLDFGIGPGLVKHFTEYDALGDDRGSRQVTTLAVLFYVALGLIVGPILVWAAPWLVSLLKLPVALRGVGESSLLIMFGYFLASSIAGVFTARLVALHRMDLASLIGVAAQAVYGLLVLLVLPRWPTVSAAMSFNLVQVALVGVISCAVVARRAGGGSLFSAPWRIDPALARKLFAFGGWMQLNNLSALVNLETDKLIIGGFLNMATVTSYEIGNRLAALNRLLPAQLLVAVMPSATIIQMDRSQEEIERFYASTSRYLMVATLAVTGLVIVTVDPLVVAWIGRRFPEATLVAISLSLSSAIHNLTGPGTILLRASGQPRYEAYYGVLSVVLNIALTVALAPRYGLVGIVGGTVIANVIGSIYFLVLFHRTQAISWRQTIGIWLWRVIAATVVAVLSIEGVKQFMPVVADGDRLLGLTMAVLYGAIYMVVFLGALAVFRFWRREDVVSVRRLFSRPARPPW